MAKAEKSEKPRWLRLRKEKSMQDEKQIQLAWNICNLLSKLSDLLWDHYEEQFSQLQQDEVIYRGSLTDDMNTDDF
jgi:hypothetical protein